MMRKFGVSRKDILSSISNGQPSTTNSKEINVCYSYHSQRVVLMS
jgi:hypothetical protein